MFICHINDLFNSILLNKGVRITRENIDEVEAFLKKKLAYFAAWSRTLQERKDNEQPHWDRTGFSKVTMRNLRVSVCGFIEFAKYILKKCPEYSYVAALACSSSSIESFFSCIRAQGGNTSRG